MSKKVILGVSGGIACYKAVGLASALTQAGYDVHAVLTKHALEFITATTYRSITKNPVRTKIFSPDNEPVPHIGLAESADLLIIAPATANVIGKIANGIGDDILTTTVLACRAPKIIVPSMNCEMWANPLVQTNIAKLKKLGFFFIEPDYGHLACGVIGKGRYPKNEIIFELAQKILQRQNILKGKKIVITGGGTREPIDPVRVIANNSSGKMGEALTNVARQYGAEVTYIQATTVDQLKADIAKVYADADCLIMAAAVSDYRPVKTADQKLKSDQPKLTIELEKTEDVLAYFGKQKKKQYLVGFALETENVLENAQKKLQSKNLDLIIANEASVIGADQTKITILDAKGGKAEYSGSKEQAAEKILERICRSLG